MISHKHKCIFVHIPKAAGTSIENMFLEDLGLDVENRHSLLLGKNNNKSIGSPRVTHLLAKEYVGHSFISQELFKEYFKFSFVRNPYNRIYSSYTYWKFSDYMSFDTFVLKKLPELIKHPKYAYFFRTQYDYLYNEGELLVDFVGKLENINEDVNQVFKKLNINHLKLKHLNKSPKTKLSFYYKLRLVGRILKDYKYMTRISSNKSKSLSINATSFLNKYYEKDFISFSYEMKEQL